MAKQLEHLIRFYALLADLERAVGGARRLAESSASSGWPQRGVYFFYEPGESRSESGTGPRVVRVGTHALKVGSRTSLWTRLSQHKGQLVSGGGNHRGSIFRLIVGAALIRRDGYLVQTWGIGSSATRIVRNDEFELEREVSRFIGGMHVVWLSIDDEAQPDSLRGYIERNSIALLSNYVMTPLDLPSGNWLGNYSDRERVRRSGLWNSNHVDEDYDPQFLERLMQLVEATGKRE